MTPARVMIGATVIPGVHDLRVFPLRDQIYRPERSARGGLGWRRWIGLGRGFGSRRREFLTVSVLLEEGSVLVEIREGL